MRRTIRQRILDCRNRWLPIHYRTPHTSWWSWRGRHYLIRGIDR